jgi:hypothetical protein
MLITFTTKHGALVIRSEDLRSIEDVGGEMLGDGGGCVIGWVNDVTGAGHERLVDGTATENRDRILADETRMIAAYEELQQRARNGMPALPVVRGGKVTKR